MKLAKEGEWITSKWGGEGVVVRQFSMTHFLSDRPSVQRNPPAYEVEFCTNRFAILHADVIRISKAPA